MGTPNNEENDDEMFVTVCMDNGNDVECQVITIFEANNQDYIALLPLDENDEANEESELIFYRYFEDEQGNPSLDNIETDEEFEIVADRFDEFLDEQEFEDMQ